MADQPGSSSRSMQLDPIKKRKSESPPDAIKGEGDKPLKPHKPLNRVSRACNACRKQKMKCEGADNPPCKRCRHAGLECLFEKPNREANLGNEAGIERLNRVEEKVTQLQYGVNSIQNSLADLIGALRGSNPGLNIAGPQPPYPVSGYPPYQQHGIPESSPGLSSHSSVGGPSGPMDSVLSSALPPTERDLAAAHALTMQRSGASHNMPRSHGPGPSQSPVEARHRSLSGGGPGSAYPRLPHPREQHATPGPVPPNYHPTPHGPPPPDAVPHQGYTSLPPIASLNDVPPQARNRQLPSIRSGMPPQDFSSHLRSKLEPAASPQHSNPSQQMAYRSRNQAGSSNVTSADSSDDEGAGELPHHGLMAPLEALRAIGAAHEQQAENGGSAEASEARTRSHSPQPRPMDHSDRPAKRRKMGHGSPAKQPHHFMDVVTRGIISEQEARELFNIFYHGCSTFLPVFDASVDTFDALHVRSPFAVDCICMVAARVRDGGGPPSETYKRISEEVHMISSQTLFSPVTKVEAVQAMVLVSGWSPNGWLSGGHAVRMALELGLHKAWPKLHRRMASGKITTSQEERELVIQARTWFCLYLFEHQMSYGTGRPAILREDESTRECGRLTVHPLSIEDDLRLVSTVELMKLRERVHNQLMPFEGPVNESTYEILREANKMFQRWYDTWDREFSQKYDDAAFYRQSLEIQRYFAELFHNATGLRGIRGPQDVQKMPTAQRHLAIRSIQIAKLGIDICLHSPSYRNGLKYAVHYTHVTATFAASFLIRLARLFPEECERFGGLKLLMADVEELAGALAEIPATRYARTLRIMLHTARKRKVLPPRSPKLHGRDVATRPPQDNVANPPLHPNQTTPTIIPSPTAYEQGAVISPPGSGPMAGVIQLPMGYPDQAVTDHYPRGFEMGQEVPIWLHESNLGDLQLPQYGLEAFIIPQQYEQQVSTEIW